MISLLRKLFIDNWQRKILAFILAIITWLFVNHSLSITKTIDDVSIRIINLPKDKIIKGMQSDSLLLQKMDLEISGNKNLIAPITNSDLEILVDLKNKKTEDYFSTIITKKNIVSKNPKINLEKAIKKLKNQEVSLQLCNYITEKIPILVSLIGEAPKDYQFLDVWPYSLFITAGGPEDTIKKLKATGLKLVFNLSLISQNELKGIEDLTKREKKDSISYFIPAAWKRVNVPEISLFPMDIDDPNAKSLRINFIKKDFIPISTSIPVFLFFPPNTSEKLNPSNITLANNDFVKKINGIDMITIPLLAEGVSELFIDTVDKKMAIIIFVESKEKTEFLSWNIQPIIPLELEKYFVKKIITSNTIGDIQPHLIEEFSKTRFRAYMNHFRLWLSPTEKLNLKITLDNNKVHVIHVKK